MGKSARSTYNSSKILTTPIESSANLRRNQSGTYFFVSSSAAVSFTLPAGQTGNYFRFIIKDGMTQQVTVSSSDNMYGPLVTQHSAGAVSITENTDGSIVLGAGAAAGSYLDVLYGDDHKWYVSGIASGSAWS